MKLSILLSILLIFAISTSLLGQNVPSNTLFDNAEITVNNTTINTRASDFGLAFVKDELWFSAYQQRDIRRVLAGRGDNSFYKIFKVPVDEEGNVLSNEKVMLTDFGTQFHEGPVAYNEQTGELFFTLSNAVEVDMEVDGVFVKRTRMRLRIEVARMVDEEWIVDSEMPFNYPTYSVGHPSLSATGDTLFFTSDIPTDNRGRTDIYMSVRQNDEWSAPMNLGDNINTDGSEMFPFFHHSGVLVFASNGIEGGKGGLDLYYSQLTPNGFTKAQPIEQLNTEYDDFGLIIHKNGRIGYFVSNRPGQEGDDDIYMIEIDKKLFSINGTIVDNTTNETIPDANVQLSDCDGNQIATLKSDTQGQFAFSGIAIGCYMVKGEKIGYNEQTVRLENTGTANVRLAPKKELDILVVDKLTRNPIPSALLKIDNTTGIKLKPDATFYSRIDENQNAVNIEVSADSYLTKKLVVETSQPGKIQRTILLSAFAKELEIIVLDYDTRVPIVNAKVVLDKQQAKPLNSSGILVSELGERQKSVSIEVGADGYLNQSLTVQTDGNEKFSETVLLMKREMDRSFVLENIYYDVNKWDILPASAIELDKLVAILKDNPDIVVELGSHTDSRGSDEYNLQLSQRRSESAVAYIVSKGIPQQQIVAKGYGETKLVNHCVNGVWCSDDDHRKNRRTEFKIIGLD